MFYYNLHKQKLGSSKIPPKKYPEQPRALFSLLNNGPEPTHWCKNPRGFIEKSWDDGVSHPIQGIRARNKRTCTSKISNAYMFTYICICVDKFQIYIPIAYIYICVCVCFHPQLLNREFVLWVFFHIFEPNLLPCFSRCHEIWQPKLHAHCLQGILKITIDLHQVWSPPTKKWVPFHDPCDSPGRLFPHLVPVGLFEGHAIRDLQSKGFRNPFESGQMGPRMWGRQPVLKKKKILYIIFPRKSIK